MNIFDYTETLECDDCGDTYETDNDGDYHCGPCYWKRYDADNDFLETYVPKNN